MDTKTCSMCKIDQSVDNFRFRNKAKNTRSPWCKPCFSQYEKDKWYSSSSEKRSDHVAQTQLRRDRNAQYIWDYLLKHPCQTCGETDPILLEFDHRDPATKIKSISDLARMTYSIASMNAEIEKCDVLCVSCHRRRTAEQFGWYKRVIR